MVRLLTAYCIHTCSWYVSIFACLGSRACPLQALQSPYYEGFKRENVEVLLCYNDHGSDSLRHWPCSTSTSTRVDSFVIVSTIHTGLLQCPQ